MEAKVEARSEESVKISITIPITNTMLEGEEAIQKAVNAVGSVATEVLLKKFDTDGSAIKVGNLNFTTKGQVGKNYQTPYGAVRVNRHVYQSSEGGRTYCPLEHNARIVETATPRFAKMVSCKYGLMGAPQIQIDMSDNHGRKIAKCMVQKLADSVSTAMELKSDSWTYSTPITEESKVKTIGIGIDGTTLRMVEGSFREAMTGTISLYDEEGNRLHTTYVGAAPQYGKEYFLNSIEREIAQTVSQFKGATCIGIADGAQSNWSFLEAHTEKQTLDFWHAAEYVNKAAKILFRSEEKQKEWAQQMCHNMKHLKTGPRQILKEVRRASKEVRGKNKRSVLASVISYFRNNLKRMTYADNLLENLPLGSGVTEAACKTLIKQRMCQSGMKWKYDGASVVIRLRAAVQTEGRWNQFWSKVSQYGYPVSI